MNERLMEIIALRSVVDALQQDDLVAVLSDVTVRSDEYIPVLKFLLDPEHLTCMIHSMLKEPSPIAKATAAAAREPGNPPTYEEYAIEFRANWILCRSGFSHQLLAGLSALKGEARATIARTLIDFNSRDSMTLEALARFLTAFMDQYSPLMVMMLFDKSSRQHNMFLESLLVLIFYEPLRDVVARLFNELHDKDMNFNVETLAGLALFQLSPINPVPEIRDRVSDKLSQRLMNDPETVKFSRMVFTCDLVTDLIHERREGSLGFALVTSLSESKLNGKQLITAALSDLETLPTLFANESYTVKVLNSLLQQSQCGCVAKAAFCRATATAHESKQEEELEDPMAACTLGSPHEDLPTIWHVFLSHLPTLLSYLLASSGEGTSLLWRFKPTHVQLVYLMLPVLNVSCTVADSAVIRARTLDSLLELVIRFPKASIMHCAIARLFIVALEDSPYMFGKELPAFRTPTDTLRLHLLLGGALDYLLRSFGWATLPSAGESSKKSSEDKKIKPPAAFLDVAISLDQALTGAFAHSSQLFMGDSAFERWKVFRLAVLLPTQMLWEEQYQPPQPLESGPSQALAAMLYGEGDQNSAQEIEHDSSATSNQLDIPPSKSQAPSPRESHSYEDAGQKSSQILDSTDYKALQAGPCAGVLSSKPTAKDVSAAIADVPTPLSALYNDEEKHMMLKVSSDEAMSTSPEVDLAIAAAVSQTT